MIDPQKDQCVIHEMENTKSSNTKAMEFKWAEPEKKKKIRSTKCNKHILEKPVFFDPWSKCS